MVKRGGKMKASLIKHFIQSTYLPEKRTPEIDGYKLDESLSDKYITTYWSDEKKKGVVSIRPSHDFGDVVSDVKAALNIYRKDKRFTSGWRMLDRVGKKYGFDNMTALGYSLGAIVLEKYKNAEKFKEIFLVSKPVLPSDIKKGVKPLSNATEIRSKLDITSFFKPWQEEAKNVELVKATTVNPIKEHQLSHFFKEIDPDKEIGFGANKMKVKELKQMIKKLRKGKASKYPITGKNKKELVKMLDELLGHN